MSMAAPKPKSVEELTHEEWVASLPESTTVLSPEAHASLLRGIEQIKAGQTVSRPSYAQYVNEEDE